MTILIHKGMLIMKGKRISNKESRSMYDNEIIHAEENVSQLLEVINEPFIGVDISKTPDQSVITYISNSRKQLNCKECLYYDKCEKRNADGLIYCFRKPRCICTNCKLKSECNDAKDGVILCPNYIPIQEISRIDYMR